MAQPRYPYPYPNGVQPDYADQQYSQLRPEQGGPVPPDDDFSKLNKGNAGLAGGTGLAGSALRASDPTDFRYSQPVETAMDVLNRRRLFPTGAERSADVDHVRLDLLCPEITKALGRVAAEGAQRYGEWNWTRGLPIRDTINHAINHLQSYLAGDGGEPHLDHAAFNIMMVLHFTNRCGCHNAALHHMQLDKMYAEAQAGQPSQKL